MRILQAAGAAFNRCAGRRGSVAYGPLGARATYLMSVGAPQAQLP